MDVKDLKALVAALPDNSGVDIVVQDANGGGIGVSGIERQLGAMDVSPVLVVLLPAGYSLTTISLQPLEEFSLKVAELRRQIPTALAATLRKQACLAATDLFRIIYTNAPIYGAPQAADNFAAITTCG